jgi:hypothetical protein
MARRKFQPSPQLEENRQRQIPAKWLEEWAAFSDEEGWRGGAECLICGRPIRDCLSAI